MFHRMMLCIFLSCVLSASWGSTVVAQTPPEPTADEKKLETLLDGTSVLYRKKFSEESQRWEYSAALEGNGETSLVRIYLKNWGTRGDGSKVFVVYCWTTVAELPKGQPMPPEIVKMIASANEVLYTGNYSIVENGVFANLGVMMQDLTSPAMGLYLADLHSNRMMVKKEIDKLLNGRQ